MEDAQLLRGILEGCVLSLIAGGETYGYEILSRLEKCGFEGLLEGTLYPVLTRLEKKGLVRCRKEKSPYGPMRKYYSATPEGMLALAEFRESYGKITAAADLVLKGEDAP
ncbi:MAG: PadR family transcriptional regulator [Oscillospiraceae bacterium]|nr:PadR family transcriptional regulator [Oscillospiraceae bacterium]MCD8375837.1 PadR family transcriptional regulator [Oscillospiraceae bacterium]